MCLAFLSGSFVWFSWKPVLMGELWACLPQADVSDLCPSSGEECAFWGMNRHLFLSHPPVPKLNINYPTSATQRSLWKQALANILGGDPLAPGSLLWQLHRKRGLSSVFWSQYERWIPSPMHSPSPGFSCTPRSSPSCLPFPLFPPEAEDFVALTFNYIKFRCLYPLWMSNCSAISTKRHRKYENRRQDLEQDYF